MKLNLSFSSDKDLTPMEISFVESFLSKILRFFYDNVNYINCKV